MTDLHALLDRCVDQPVDVGVAATLHRGRSALRRRRRTLVAGVAVAVVTLGATTTALAGTSTLSLQPSHAVDPRTVHAGAFEIPPPPDGWSVQAADESLVVIAPDGLPKVDMSDPHLQLPVMGKLAIEYLDNSDPLQEGAPIEYDGRKFYPLTGAGSPRRVSVQETSGRWLVVQEAPTLHWTLQQMIEFLDEVRVDSSAIPGSD